MQTQRLVHRLRERDWLGVVIEIVVVIVGILIALQLDNWNQERQARAQAEVWRAGIVEDLRATQRSLRARAAYYSQALAFAESTLPALQARDALTPAQGWEVVLGAFQAGQIWPLRINGPTYREVQAAGGLSLVTHREALTKLSSYYDNSAYDNDVIAGGSPPYRDRIREVLPWPLQRHIWNSDCQGQRVNPEDGGFVFFLQACAKPGAELDADVLAAVARMRGDGDLQDLLRGRMSQLAIVQAAFLRNVENIDAIVASVQGGE